jgi:hypothetical protein
MCVCVVAACFFGRERCGAKRAWGAAFAWSATTALPKRLTRIMAGGAGQTQGRKEKRAYVRKQKRCRVARFGRAEEETETGVAAAKFVVCAYVCMCVRGAAV